MNFFSCRKGRAGWEEVTCWSFITCPFCQVHWSVSSIRFSLSVRRVMFYPKHPFFVARSRFLRSNSKKTCTSLLVTLRSTTITKHCKAGCRRSPRVWEQTDRMNKWSVKTSKPPPCISLHPYHIFTKFRSKSDQIGLDLDRWKHCPLNVNRCYSGIRSTTPFTHVQCFKYYFLSLTFLLFPSPSILQLTWKQQSTGQPSASASVSAQASASTDAGASALASPSSMVAPAAIVSAGSGEKRRRHQVWTQS